MEPLLAGRVPDLEFDLFPPQLDGLDLEVNPDGRYECRVEGIVGEPEKNASLSDSGVSDEKQFEQQVVGFLRHYPISIAVS